MTKSNLEGTGSVWFTLLRHGPLLEEFRAGTQTACRNLEAEADAEAMEGCCLQSCSLWLAQPAFLENPGPPTQGWQYPQQRTRPHSSLTMKTFYRFVCLQPDRMEAFLACKIPSSQMTTALCQVDIQLASTVGNKVGLNGDKALSIAHGSPCCCGRVSQ